MTDEEAREKAARYIAVSAEENLKFQYWFSLVLAAPAVVIAPIATVWSFLVYFPFQDRMDWEDFGTALAYAWGFFLIGVAFHWSVRRFAKKVGKKVLFYFSPPSSSFFLL